MAAKKNDLMGKNGYHNRKHNQTDVMTAKSNAMARRLKTMWKRFKTISDHHESRSQYVLTSETRKQYQN